MPMTGQIQSAVDITVCAGQRGGNTESVMLATGETLISEAPARQSRTYFGDGGGNTSMD
jgi:hypothetical protein